MKIFVTGGAGFIGSSVIRWLIAETDHTVVNIDKLTYAANLASLLSMDREPRYALRKVDICDGQSIRALFSAFKPDSIMHLAAESHVDRSIDGPGAFITTNVVGTYTLLEAAREYWQSLDAAGRGAFRFLHISTDEVYGALGDTGAFSEGDPYRPNSPYAASKASSDHLARAWYATYGLPVITSNCCNNYGAYQFPEKLVPLMILNALHGRALPVYGDGRQSREWIHVEDHARALCAILMGGRVGETYNVGTGEERRNVDLVHSICDLVDVAEGRADGTSRRLIEHVVDRPGHDRRYAIDSNKITRELSWRPNFSLDDGLAQTVLWYRENKAWWAPIVRDKYDQARLGLGSGGSVGVSQRVLLRRESD